MKIITETITKEVNGFSGIANITGVVQNVIYNSKMLEGSALVFAVGSTSGITTIEYEPGLIKDYPQFFEKIIPSSSNYNHDETWHDGNGFAHIRSSLQGTSLTVPFKNSELLLGTWQQIILINFDNRTRKRNVVVQLTGE